jgi:hypothetical protein
MERIISCGERLRPSAGKDGGGWLRIQKQTLAHCGMMPFSSAVSNKSFTLFCLLRPNQQKIYLRKGRCVYTSPPRSFPAHAADILQARFWIGKGKLYRAFKHPVYFMLNINAVNYG